MSTRSQSKTALITGASSGLGAEYATQLVAMGYNLILTTRREERLQQLGALLQSEFDMQAQIQPADLSKLTEIEKLTSTIDSLDNLDLLVNNAGYGTV